MRKVLRSDFFRRPSPVVAAELLGKFLVRRYRRRTHGFMITEVEVYDGLEDQASHAIHGLTRRTAPMFGPAGFWYVYLIYGMYNMLNVVTREHGYPAAILIRAVDGHPGPGKLTKALNIPRRINGQPLRPRTGLWIEDRDVQVPIQRIHRTARVGVDYAGSDWSRKKWRFVLY